MRSGITKLCALFAVAGFTFGSAQIGRAMDASSMIIDNFSKPHPEAAIGTSWRFVADTVMGGVSTGKIARTQIGPSSALQLSGRVSLDNNGGFIQAALPLAEAPNTLDARGFSGIEFTVRGNGQSYSVHLRTSQLNRPWQSYRSTIQAVTQWQTHRLPFDTFKAYRTEVPLDIAKLTRLGLVAIGRAFDADLAVRDISFYK